MRKTRQAPLYQHIRKILESARAGVARSVNTTQVISNWLIGREIVEEEQKGQKRAGYGEELLAELSVRLTNDFGKGFSVRNLEYYRNFYLEYPRLLEGQISNAVRSIFPKQAFPAASEISHAARAKSEAARRKSSSVEPTEILYAPRRESWQPGQLHPSLSWTHYRTLLRFDKPERRAFYEIEALK